MIIVSACLAGINCNYKGGCKPCEKVIQLVKEGKAIPVCPEQLAGLPTPRIACENKGDRVVNKEGTDMTEIFQQGAKEALKIAQLVGAREAILKARSPSCGSNKVYDGTFTVRLKDGDGVFAKLCKENGIKVLTEEEL